LQADAFNNVSGAAEGGAGGGDCGGEMRRRIPIGDLAVVAIVWSCVAALIVWSMRIFKGV
jgi:hypothetical protein